MSATHVLDLPRDQLEFVWIALDTACKMTEGGDAETHHEYLGLAKRFKPSRWNSKGRRVEVTRRELGIVAQLVLK